MKKQTTKFLHFSMISGVGTLTCNDCGYSSSLHASTHGSAIFLGYAAAKPIGSFRPTTTANIGHQCQLCGRFDTVSGSNRKNPELENELDKMIKEGMYFCECGGELEYGERQEELPSGLILRSSKIPGFICKKCNKYYPVYGVEEVSELGKKIREKYKKKDKKHICKCGGELKNDAPIFCPKCQSFNLKYKTEYLT